MDIPACASDLSDAAWRSVRATAADAVIDALQFGSAIARVQGVEIDARLDRRGIAGARRLAWVRLVLRREQQVVDRALACIDEDGVCAESRGHG